MLKTFWDNYTSASQHLLGTPYPWILIGIIAIASVLLPGVVDLVLWGGFLLFQGAACWSGYRRCGRAHCRVTGPGFILLGAMFVLTAAGIVPLIEISPAVDFYTLVIIAVLGAAVLYEVFVKLTTGSVFVGGRQ